MLFLRYTRSHWLKVRVERVGIPMLTAIPLLTLPQFLMLQYVSGKGAQWSSLSLYDKYNTLVWELISHLWFLLVLVVMTTLCVWLFKRINQHQDSIAASARWDNISHMKLTLIFLGLGIGYAALRRAILLIHAPLLSDGLFNFVVMQSLFYLPFFILGALAFKHPQLKALFTTPSLGCALGSLVAFIAYIANQRYGDGGGWMYEKESVILMLMGLWMVNVVFGFGHRMLNSHSPLVTYFVNASLFIYLVHHPLTLFYGAFITPHIGSNTLGFALGLVFVIGIAIALYEIHLRIPVLRFLFSGKPARKPVPAQQLQ
ncbi:glucans biosynthesis protein C [Salmonella enterica subsp. enterica serovar Choleraesuis]|nr:glucans biosynthesis protein C [Salmonella enterica subsp. enterica serovar Choleraesuis]